MLQGARDAAGELPWGVTFIGRGEPETAADAIENALQAAGMTSQRQELGTGRLRITGLQRAGPLAILVRALLQRAEWRIEHRGGVLRISSDFLCFRWFAVCIVGMALWILTAIWLGYRLLDQPVSAELRPWLVLAGLVCAGLAFVVPRWIGTLGSSSRTVRIWRAVIREIEHQGGGLEPDGREISLRYAVPVLAYVVSMATMALYVILSSFQGPILRAAWLPIGLTAALFVAVGFLLSIPCMSLFQRGMVLRMEAMTSGLVTATTALFFFVGLPLIWQAVGLYPENQRRLISRAEAALAGESASTLTPQELAASARELTNIRIRVRVVLVVFVSLALLGGLVWLYGVHLSINSWFPLWRLRKHRQRRSYRQAIGDPTLLRRFRQVYLPVWALVSAMVLAGCVYILLCAFQAAVPVFKAPELRLAEVSADLTALALGRRFGDPWTAGISRVVWILYGLVVIAVLLISTGQLARERRRERRRLALAAAPSGAVHRQFQDRLDHLRSNTTLGPVALALDREAAGAYAQSFGLRGHERYVVVPLAVAELHERGQLEQRELDTLLAHELAHLVYEHPRRLYRMRWLGRLTFVGDGFALAIQHTFGDELEADAEAVELGARPDALEPLLLKLSVQRKGRQLQRRERALAGPGLLPLTSSGEPLELADLTWRERWSWAWRLYRQQYFHAFEILY